MLPDFSLFCCMQDVVRRYKETHSDFSNFADKVVFQLNDTHPTIAVPELMRVLMDENKMGWSEAWGITTKACPFHRHDALILPSLFKSAAYFHRVGPAQYKINCRLNVCQGRTLPAVEHSMPES